MLKVLWKRRKKGEFAKERRMDENKKRVGMSWEKACKERGAGHAPRNKWVKNRDSGKRTENNNSTGDVDPKKVGKVNNTDRESAIEQAELDNEAK